MSLGVLGGNTLGLGAVPRRALGASVIPGRCWDKPGFKKCHANEWHQAESDCKKTGAVDFDGDISKCIEVMTDAGAFDNCIPQLCPEEKSRGTVQVGPVYAEGDDCGSQNTIKFVQFVVGTAVDGKWGPKSQAAYEKYFATTGDDYYDIAKKCKGTGPVPRKVAVVQPKPKEVEPPPVIVEPKSQVSKGALLAGVGIVGALAVGGYYYGQKKGWFQ